MDGRMDGWMDGRMDGWMANYIFGITGATGAGKSTVSDLFRKNGIYVADADAAARAVAEPGMPCLLRLSEAFGSEIINADGSLNRRDLAEIVFSDKNKLKLLNSITHSYITEYIKNEIDASTAEFAAIDGAVIIGSPVEELCRMLVVVTADNDTRLKRIMDRDGISREAAQNRIDSQMSNDEYIKHSTYNINNNGCIDRLGVQIEQICNEIKTLSKKESP